MRILLALLLTLSVGFARAADNTPPEGFTALFNGKDLTGWKGLAADIKAKKSLPAEELAKKQEAADKQATEHWKAVDGVLVYDGKGNSLSTAKDYGDFEMYLDWKIGKGGDSGIYLRGTPQVQIWDPTHEPDFKNGADKGSGSLWNNQKSERWPLAKADKPIGDWNTFHITMVGDQVKVELNGKLVTDTKLENYWERDKPLYETGPIELQHHGNPLYFKNIYIKELKK